MTEEHSNPNGEKKDSEPDSCQAEKEKEYLERYRFWSNNSIQQFSFSNNLLLTISIAVFGYFFGKRDKIYTELYFDFNAEIDWVVLFFLIGSILIALSIIFGAILSISRLYDFRLTRHISIVRKRVCQKAGEILKDEDLKKTGRLSAFIDLGKVFFCFNKFSISLNECLTIDENLKSKIKKLREISFSLGRTTWLLFNLQFLFFLFGIMFFAAVVVFM